MKYKRASKEEYKHLLTCFLSSAPIWYFVTFRNWNFAGFLGASFANREGQALKQQGSLWLLNMTNEKEKKENPVAVLAFSVYFLPPPYSVGNKKGWFGQEQKVIVVNNCGTQQEQ